VIFRSEKFHFVKSINIKTASLAAILNFLRESKMLKVPLSQSQFAISLEVK
jgi:hypothetical protein